MLRRDRPESWAHQKAGKAMMTAREGKGTLLAFPPGAGKTRPTIERIEEMHKAGKANLVLVVNVLSGLHVWVDNWADWANIPALFIDLREAGSDGLRIAKDLSAQGNLCICIVSYTAAWWIGYTREKKSKKVPGQAEHQMVSVMKKIDTGIEDLEWDIAVLDEIHKIKSPSARASIFFREKVAPKTKERFGLTGSLIKKRPGDAWAVARFLTGGEVFPPTYGAFTGLYGIPHPHIRGAVIAWHNLDDFAKRLAKFAYVVSIKDCMDLPPQIHSYHKVELGKKSKKLYHTLSEDLYTELESWEEDGKKSYTDLIEHFEQVWPEQMTLETSLWEDSARPREDVAKDALRFYKSLFDNGTLCYRKTVVLSRFRAHALSVRTVTINHVFNAMRKQLQITSGFIRPDAPDDDPGQMMEPVQIGTEKIDAMLDVLDVNWPSVDEPEVKPTLVIVTSDPEEKMVAEAIEKHFKFKPKILNGSVTGAAKRHELIASGAKDPVFIMKAQVGAESIDCKWARTFVFMSKTPDTIQYDQLLARNMRGGQTETCTYVHIIAKGTVDERIEDIIHSNLNLAKAIEKDWRALL